MSANSSRQNVHEIPLSLQAPTGENLIAHRLSARTNPTTKWPIETWVIRQSDMTPVAQVELYFFAKDRQWHAWLGPIVGGETKKLSLLLQDARNREDEESP